jgi:hypothetical protein
MPGGGQDGEVSWTMDDARCHQEGVGQQQENEQEAVPLRKRGGYGRQTTAP